MRALPRFLIKSLLFSTAALTLLAFSVHLTNADCVNETDCQSQINQQSSQLTSIQAQQAALQSLLNSARSTLSATNTQLAAMQEEANGINAELTQTQVALDKTKSLFRARVRDLYMRAQTNQWEAFFTSNF